MTNEATTIVIAAAILAGRIWSAFEHKKTSDKVNKIEINLNGDMERRLKEQYEKGYQDGKNQK